jgi:hypothetical protein
MFIYRTLGSVDVLDSTEIIMLMLYDPHALFTPK